MSDDLRNMIAREIRAQQVPCEEHPMPFPKPSCWTCGRNGAFHRAALIALGEFPKPSAPLSASPETTTPRSMS